MAEERASPTPALASIFPATAWTLVERAVAGEPGAQRSALNELAERYWRPIYVYLRGTGRPLAEAEDLTQAFFTHLFEKHLLERVRIRQVCFRAYLRSVLEHFLANAARAETVRKRHAGFSIDVQGAESWLAARSPQSPQDGFDEMWALELLEAAVRRLREELRRTDREWVADALMARTGLGTASESASVQVLGQRFGVTENQLSVALHRARARLRELILEEIRQSVATPAEADEELRKLFTVLQRRHS